MMRRFVLFLVMGVACAAAEPSMSQKEKDTALTELAEKLKPVMGEDWDALLTRFNPAFATANTKPQFYDVVHDLFAATNKSHFYVLPPEAAKLDRAQASDFGRTGIVCSLVSDIITVVAVAETSPAAKAGIAPGFIIETLDGVDLGAVVKAVKASTADAHKRRVLASRRVNYWLRGRPKQTRTIVGRTAGGKVATHTLVLEKPAGTPFKQGHLGDEWLEFESKRLNDGKVGYVRFNVFAMPLLKRVRKAITSFVACEAIIIDLRGNPGGLGMMAIPIAGMFLEARGNLGETQSGEDVFRYPVFPVKTPYAGRLIILTNELSASTSEILTAGLQECGRATVIGTRTMGAVLPSLIIKLENGGIIQYPIGDFKTPKGVLLEGRGVKPDVVVEFDDATLKTGSDPILARALETIVKKGGKAK